MSRTTHPTGMQTPTATTTAGGGDRQDARRSHRVEMVLWALGLVVFIASCFTIHAHPQPYPFDLSTTQTVQGFHFWSWVNSVLNFPSVLNDPIPSAVALSIWFVGMLLAALTFRLK